MTMRSGEMVFSGERGLVVSFWKDLKESGHFWLLHNVSNSLERSVLPSWIIAKGGKITHSKNGNWTALASQEPPKISVQGPPQRSCKDWATGPALCPGVTAPALEPSLDCNTPTEVATQSPGRWGDTNSTQNTSSPRSYALHFFNSCLHLDARGTGGSFGGSAFSEKFVPTVVSWAAHGMNASQGSSTVCPWCQKGLGFNHMCSQKLRGTTGTDPQCGWDHGLCLWYWGKRSSTGIWEGKSLFFPRCTPGLWQAQHQAWGFHSWHLDNNRKVPETPWTPDSLYRHIWLHLNRWFFFVHANPPQNQFGFHYYI